MKVKELDYAPKYDGINLMILIGYLVYRESRKNDTEI